MKMIAARFTDNIQRDIERGMSIISHLAEVGETPEECMELFQECFPGRNTAEITPVYDEDVEGYLPAREGICAFVADTEEEAIELARENWEDGGRLYVFECTVVDEDDVDDENTARVLPTGEVKEVE